LVTGLGDLLTSDSRQSGRFYAAIHQDTQAMISVVADASGIGFDPRQQIRCEGSMEPTAVINQWTQDVVHWCFSLGVLQFPNQLFKYSFFNQFGKNSMQLLKPAG
jgi:hypothetical protein